MKKPSGVSPSDAAIDKADVDNYISTRDDFGLELAMLRVARSNGFDALHAGTYEDPIKRIPRQFDIRASIHNRKGNGRTLGLAIECKAIDTRYPVVVQRTPRLNNEASLHVLLRTKLTGVYSPADARLIRGASVATGTYREGEMVGRAITQLTRAKDGTISGGNTELHAKWSQAIASSYDLASDLAGHVRSGVTARGAVLPVLVLADSTLFVCDYDADGKPVSASGSIGAVDARQVDSTTFYIGHAVDVPLDVTMSLTHLHITTETGCRMLLERLGDMDSAEWDETFPGPYDA